MRTELALTMIVIILIYAGLGIWHIRRSRGSDGFFLADRKVGWALNGLAIVASFETLNLMMGIPASAYRSFLLTLGIGIGATMGLITLQVFAGPLRAYGSFTPVEFLTMRYGNKATLVGVVALIFIQFGYLLANLTGFGLVLNWAFGIDYKLGLVLGMLILLVFTVFGGMWSVTHGAGLKAIVIVVFGAVALMGVARTANFDLWWLPWFSPQAGKAAYTLATSVRMWGASITWTDLLAPISLALAWVVGVAGMPHLVVRSLTAADKRTAYKSLVLSVVVFGFCIVQALLMGLYGRILLPQYPTGMLSDRMVLDLMGTAGIWVTGLYLAALMATVLVTGGTILLATAGVIVNDVYKRFINPQATSEKMVLVGRIVVVVVTVIGIVLAIKPPAFIALMVAWSFGLTASTLGIAYIMGLFSDRTSEIGVIAGMVVGGLSFILMSYFKIPAVLATGTPALISIPLGLCVCWIVSLLIPRTSDEIIRKLHTALAGESSIPTFENGVTATKL